MVCCIFTSTHPRGIRASSHVRPNSPLSSTLHHKGANERKILGGGPKKNLRLGDKIPTALGLKVVAAGDDHLLYVCTPMKIYKSFLISSMTLLTARSLSPVCDGAMLSCMLCKRDAVVNLISLVMQQHALRTPPPLFLSFSRIFVWLRASSAPDMCVVVDFLAHCFILSVLNSLVHCANNFEVQISFSKR
eukprot:1161690-Pelagomonas_calceolata.AAC.2